jgi:hypothetical protein
MTSAKVTHSAMHERFAIYQGPLSAGLGSLQEVLRICVQIELTGFHDSLHLQGAKRRTRVGPSLVPWNES